MSKKINLGKVAITPKGKWTEDTEYELLDAVFYGGSLWIAKASSVGMEPSSESEYWEIALEASTTEEEVVAFLPDNIYVASGCTIEIYNRQVCADVDRYHFKWTCDIGKIYERKFSVTGSDDTIGTHSLTLDIVDNRGNTLWSKTVSLVVVNNTVSALTVICPIGDIHTDGRAWLGEVQTLSANYIEYSGSCESVEGYFHEGRSGWTSEMYLNRNQSFNIESGSLMKNPFWDGTFSWSYYINSMGRSPSAVQLFFGERELMSVSDVTLADNLVEMVNTIKREGDSDMPIFVVLPPCPGSRDGMAEQAVYGGIHFNGKSKYEIDKKFISAAKTICERFSADKYSNVYFVPITQCHDSEYNFATEDKPVNPRATQTVPMHSEAIKPAQQGYEQMADVMFSTYCAVFGA